MILSRTFEPPDLVAATVTGLLTDEDQAELVRWVRDWIGAKGSVRVLLVLHRFSGWRPAQTSHTSAIWLGETDAVSRIAVVGDDAWKARVLTMVAQPIHPIPIAYFSTQHDARDWLGTPRGDQARAS